MVPIRDHTPTGTVPVVNYLLLFANLAAWLVEWGLLSAGASWVVPWWGLVPARFLADPAGEAQTIFSSMFLHGDWAHLGGNLLFLWIFGDNIEDALGHLRYLAFYLLGGVAAALAQIAVGPASTIPMVGASGAISAVLGAYLVLYPRSQVTVFNPAIVLWLFIPPLLIFPAWLVIGMWFFFDNLLQGLATLGLPSQGGVAFWAHIGGFVGGLLLVKPLMLGRRAAEPDPWRGFRPPPRAVQRGVVPRGGRW